MNTYSAKILIGLLVLLIIIPELDAQVLDFGDVQLGKSKDSSAVLTNPFPVPFVVNASTIKNVPSDFAIIAGGAPFTIQPGGSHAVAMRFTPTTLGVRTDTLTLEGLFPGSPVIITLTGNGIPLPVEYLSFTAIRNGDGVVLRWVTAMEQNNHGFEIQHSCAPHGAGGNDFQTIGFVRGAGHSFTSREYQYRVLADRSECASAPLRYRLKQIDFDGGTSYSSTIVVLDESETSRGIAAPTVFPNPSQGTVVISVTISPHDRLRKITVFDILGRLTGRVVLDTETSSVTGVYARILEPHFFPKAGLYRIRVTTETGTAETTVVRLL